MNHANINMPNARNIPEFANNIETEDKASSPSLPIATIIIIFIAAYVAILGLLILICKCSNSKLKFGDCCSWFFSCFSCCECIKNCATTCDCRIPTANDCLDVICPARQRLNCVECLICDWASFQLCREGATYTCGSEDCSCTCEAPQCESINCLCCEISFRNAAVV